jgi:uncharacterized ferritin-like protein (DUF455 family)
MPEQFYRDWLKVAKEEAYHFQLLETHLHSMDSYYGAYPAHNSLWEMAEKPATICWQGWRWCRAHSKRAGSM